MTATEPPLPPAFFLRDGDGGDRYVATELTRGPWSPDHQHGGPPSALLVEAIERRLRGIAGEEARVVRLTVDFLRPIPVAGTLAVRTDVLRSGRKVQELTAVLLAGDDAIVRAAALAIRTRTPALPSPPAEREPLVGPAPARPAPPEASAPFEFPYVKGGLGSHKGVELRLASGRWGSGVATMWFRMRRPLVAGEEPSPFARVALAADSGNGVSAVLDPARDTFVNPDLTVYLDRPPEGEWVCLDSTTRADPSHGVGLAESALFDPRGPIGRSLQSLVIEPRT